MRNIEINFNNYGSCMMSRLQSRDLCNKLFSDLNGEIALVLNFEGVSIVSLSFLTEMIAHLQSHNLNKAKIINVNPRSKRFFYFAALDMKYHFYEA